jgi:lysophospholipase L1-like esterase
MKDSKNRRGLIVTLVLSLVANVLLLIGMYYVSVMKTDFYKRVKARLGFIENEEMIFVEERVQDRCDYRCIEGWTNMLEKMDYDADVVFFGNSITRDGDFQKYFSKQRICNLGRGSDDLDGIIFRVGQIKAVNPEKVFVMAGINGLRYQSEVVFESKYQRVVDSIRIAVPGARIYLQSILPVNHSMKKGGPSSKKIKVVNEIIAEIAAQSNCVYVDLWSLYEVDGEMPEELTRDGVHLYPEAYERWMEEIRKYIE